MPAILRSAAALCVLLYPSTTSAICVNTTDTVDISDLGIVYSGTAANNTSAISVTAPSSQSNNLRIDNVGILAPFFGISINRSGNFVISRCHIWAPRVGIYVRNDNNADSGDSTITGCDITMAQTEGIYGILQESSGGLRVINNKLNGGQIGIFVNWASNTNSGVGLFNSNSIEGYIMNGVRIQRASGYTGEYVHSSISNNEIGGIGNAIAVPTQSGTFVRSLVANSNVMIGPFPGVTAYMIDIDSTDGLTAIGNTMRYVGGTGARFRLGSGVANAVIGLSGGNGGFGTSAVTCAGTITCVAPY